MKTIALIISLLFISLLFFTCRNNNEVKNLKSVFKFQNDTIVGIQTYDKSGRLIFDRTTQIIADWDNELMSWMTAIEYENELKIFEYYAHSNSGLRITIFDYNQDGELRNEYSKYYSSSNRKERNPFEEIYQITERDSLISYLDQTIPNRIPFSLNNRSTRENTQFYSTYLDSSNLLVKEFETKEDSQLTHKTIEKYDANGNLVYKYEETPWNKGIDHFKYNLSGNLIEKIEFWDMDNMRFQRKEYHYENEKMKRIDFYHGEALAFKYEYFYEDTILVKEVITRITESIHFKKRKKIEVIDYKYDYH